MSAKLLSYVRRHHVALLALFVALGGTSYAAVRLPAGSVGGKQLRKNAVSSPKVKNRSLRAADFARGQLPRGEQGEQGPPGLRGEQGPPGIQDGTAAGGDLTGTYPSPQIAGGAVNSAKVADRSLTGLDIAHKSGRIALDFGAIAAHTCATAGLGTTGSSIGDLALVGTPALGHTGTPPPDFPVGLVVTGRSHDDVLGIQVCNVTAASINPPNANFPYMIVRPL